MLFASLGNRLARSLDAGVTWTLLAPSAPLVTGRNLAAHEWLAVGPDGTVWTARRNVLFRSADRGITFQQQPVTTSNSAAFGLTRISFSRLQPTKAVLGGNLNNTS